MLYLKGCVRTGPGRAGAHSQSGPRELASAEDSACSEEVVAVRTQGSGERGVRGGFLQESGGIQPALEARRPQMAEIFWGRSSRTCKKHRYREHRVPCIESVFWCAVHVGEEEEMHLKQAAGSRAFGV